MLVFGLFPFRLGANWPRRRRFLSFIGLRERGCSGKFEFLIAPLETAIYISGILYSNIVRSDSQIE